MKRKFGAPFFWENQEIEISSRQGGENFFGAELPVRLPVHEIVYGPDTGRKGPGQGRRMMLHTSPTIPSGVQHQEDACFMMWQAHSSSP